MLVNATNSGMIRLFCAQHVIDEFYERAEEWADKAEIDLPVFLARWDADYRPVLRLVDVPPGLLTPAETERIALLEHGPKKVRDPDDAPTATLALLLGAYLLSGDHAPLYAVYGPDADLTEHNKWLGMLQSGGNAGVLRQMQKDNEETIAFAGRSVFTVLELLWTEVSPIAALLVGGAAMYGYRRMPPATRQRIADAITSLLAQHAQVADWYKRETDAFLAAAAPIPTWKQMAQTLPAEAVLTRACPHTVARAGRGDDSAGQLATVLGFVPVPHSETRIRTVLRSTSAFHQHARGRFQLGQPASVNPTLDTPVTDRHVAGTASAA